MEEQKHPIPTVGAVILNPEGKILLLKSHKWHDKYVIPGGHVEVGEKLEDAVRREVKEETGLDVDVIEFIKPTEFIFDPVFYKRRHFVFLDFFCKAGSSDVQLNDEAEEFVWVTPEEALKMALEPYTRPLIEWLLAKKPRRA